MADTVVNLATEAMMNEALSQKVDKVPGKGLSANDYTSEDKAKLEGVEEQANKTIVVAPSTSASDTGKAADAKATGDALALKADLLEGKVPDTQLPTYINNADYDSQAKKINLKHGNTVVVQIDAAAFIKDGMVSSVAIVSGNLVITFNTDAGKDPVSIPLTDIFNPANYYDKTSADQKFVPQTRTVNGKALSSDITLTASDVSAATSAQGAKADTAIQTVKVNGAALTPDANKAVNIPVPVKATTAPVIAGTAAIGDSAKFAAENHVHPAETEVVAYRLPDDCFPITYTYNDTYYTVASNDGLMFDAGAGCEVYDVANGQMISVFNLSDLTWFAPDWTGPYIITNLKFANTSPTENTWPVLEKDAVFVREVRVAKEADVAAKLALKANNNEVLKNSGNQTLDGDLTLGTFGPEKTLWFNALTGILGLSNIGGVDRNLNLLWKWPNNASNGTLALLEDIPSTPNLDYVMRVNPETGEIYYTTPDTNANA